jgi:solute carrier family 24 (sodium/potassium/calcium exchanger), member 6
MCIFTWDNFELFIIVTSIQSHHLSYIFQATVPIPCDGYYNRGVIATSLALSPLWFVYYVYSGHDINLLAMNSIFYFLICWSAALCVASLVLRFAPGGDGSMALGVATPIALYGFVIAATWIDFVADHLVALLDFMGIVLHIPGTIMGLTVLAWGNSMGDLSANITMARKGLANMAMTACFAGPVFNILMGLGLGFASLVVYTGEPEKEVKLSPSVVIGIIFIIFNSASILFTGLFLGQGRVQTYYGYTALALYTIYLVSSIALQFSKYGDS